MTDKADTPELRGCPCCGASPEMLRGKTNTGSCVYSTSCVACKCGMNTGYHKASTNKARHIWNTRHNPTVENKDGFDKFLEMLEREPQHKPRLAALLAESSILENKCPHNRIDHNLECLDCDEPIWAAELENKEAVEALDHIKDHMIACEVDCASTDANLAMVRQALSSPAPDLMEMLEGMKKPKPTGNELELGLCDEAQQMRRVGWNVCIDAIKQRLGG